MPRQSLHLGYRIPTQPIYGGWSIAFIPGTGWVLVPPPQGAGGNVQPHPSAPPVRLRLVLGYVDLVQSRRQLVLLGSLSTGWMDSGSAEPAERQLRCACYRIE
jgi:hypothetical protein